METRERIEDFLHQHPLSSTREIAQGVSCSPSTVRRHLRALREQGVLGEQPCWISRFGYTWLYYLQDRCSP